MDRLLAFRLIQVAIAAPWIYHISGNKGTPAYFNVGLKLLAGAIVMVNAPPILQAMKQHSDMFQRMYADYLNGQNGVTVDSTATAIDVETVP